LVKEPFEINIVKRVLTGAPAARIELIGAREVPRFDNLGRRALVPVYHVITEGWRITARIRSGSFSSYRGQDSVRSW
jgi:hypothetical protein